MISGITTGITGRLTAAGDACRYAFKNIIKL